MSEAATGKRAAGLSHQEDRIDPEHVAQLRKQMLPDTRTPIQVFLDEPPAGRSAWDRMDGARREAVISGRWHPEPTESRTERRDAL